MAGTPDLYRRIWAKLLDRLDAEHPDWIVSRRPVSKNDYETKSPIGGCRVAARFGRYDRLSRELYIDTSDPSRNLVIFNHFFERKDKFEEAYGRKLTWEPADGHEYCRIAEYRDDCSPDDAVRHSEFVDWIVDTEVRLRRAIAAVGEPPR